MLWRIELFERKHHDRNLFSSGSAILDRYIKERVTPHARQGVSRTYVAVPQMPDPDPEPDPEQAEARPVQGFYTLSAGSLEFQAFPEALSKKLPRYPIPVALLGRLAVDQTVQGRGLGGALLFDAISRVIGIAEEMGIVAIRVDAKDERAAGFYRHHGFIPFEEHALKLVLPLTTAIKLRK